MVQKGGYTKYKTLGRIDAPFQEEEKNSRKDDDTITLNKILIMQKLPHQLSVYIRENFPEGFLSEIKPIEDENGHLFYKIDVNDNETVYHLEFNEKGNLIKHESERLYAEVFYEKGFYGNEG